MTRADLASGDFPTHCGILVADLAVAIGEFPTAGRRPTPAPWQR